MEIDFIKTSDVNLAATLYTLGFPIDGIYYSGVGVKMDFYFRDEERLRTAMNSYYQRTLRVEPSELLHNRKEIVDRVKYEASVKQPEANKRE